MEDYAALALLGEMLDKDVGETLEKNDSQHLVVLMRRHISDGYGHETAAVVRNFTLSALPRTGLCPRTLCP